MVSTKRSRAVMTMAQNESVFLPIWWRYYAQFFRTEDIYILDHQTSDGSTSGPGFQRIPVYHSKVDWGWHRDMLQKYQHWLIQQYEIVLCTDVDEIVAPDPRQGSLGDYLDSFSLDFVNCRGYEVLHRKEIEEPFDRTRKILNQRSYWYFNEAYSKPIMARVPMYWHGGLHCRTDGQKREDPSLFLIHLHRFDYDICFARHQHRAAQPWNQRDVDENWGYQNRITDPEQFHWWFYNDTCSATPMQVEQIPDHWREVI